MDEASASDQGFVYGFYKFAMDYHAQELSEILLQRDDEQHYSVQIGFQELHSDERFESLANLLCSKPKKFLPLLDEGLRKAEVDVAAVHELQEEMSLKKNVHGRITLMECPEMKMSISRIRCCDIGRILAVRGTIIRTGGVKMLEGEREYECAKCQHRFKVAPQLEEDNKLSLPPVCPSNRIKPCKSTNFTYVSGSKVCQDYQEIKIQEEVHGLGVGSVPRSIVVVLEDDLVDCCRAGDEVEVTGILCCKWRPSFKGVRCDLETVITANNICKASADKAAVDLSPEVIERFEEYWGQYKDCPLKGRNGILKGICPQVYGLFTVKLAVALTLIGGVARVDKSGTRIRGEPHLLIVGDPGTGKSQFMKYAAKLSARSVITTGMGSTGAGLTVTAVKDNGEWMLEAGALVLADGGLCCIDEFDGIREADRATIHEAMEQQTLSVAKAGLVTTLNTRCTVFAVCNPKGHYDPDNSLEVNTSLAAPLLSRFDIVLVLLDTKNPDWDRVVAKHILTEHRSAHCDEEVASPSSPTPAEFWSIDMLRSYIYYVKDAFQPGLTPDAERVIVNYYQLQRRTNAGNRNQARTTIRMLESLVRIAQAHARLMFRNEVQRTDAIVAVVTVESSMTTSAILENMTNALHSSFKEEPDQEYDAIEAQILTRLGIPLPSQEERALERTRGRRGAGSERGEVERVAFGEAEAVKEREIERPELRSEAFEAAGGEERQPVAPVQTRVAGQGEPVTEELGVLRGKSTGCNAEKSREPQGVDEEIGEEGHRSGLSARSGTGGRCHVNAWDLRQGPESSRQQTASREGDRGPLPEENGAHQRCDSKLPFTRREEAIGGVVNNSSQDQERQQMTGCLSKPPSIVPGGDRTSGSCPAEMMNGQGALGRERRRAEALKMLEEFDDEILRQFEESGPPAEISYPTAEGHAPLERGTHVANEARDCVAGGSGTAARCQGNGAQHVVEKAQATNALIQSLTQRLARPSPNALRNAAEPCQQQMSKDGLALLSTSGLVPLRDREANRQPERPKENVVRKRRLQGQNGEDAAGGTSQWLPDEQWGIEDSPRKKACEG